MNMLGPLMRTEYNRRLFLENDLSMGAQLSLNRDQSHYLATVLRAKKGMKLAVFNGRDGEWAAEVISIEKRSVTLSLLENISAQIAEPDVWLVFAPIKKTRIDFVAQKATELGASKLLPMFTERTIADRVNTDRLLANAIEAAEQCERLTIPSVEEPQKINTITTNWPADRHIMFCDESLDGERALLALSKLKASIETNAPWAIFIGPEGGFTEDERTRLNNMPQSHPVTLGPRILRADTAAMAALSIWQTVFGDW